jgi:hypothetical protein
VAVDDRQPNISVQERGARLIVRRPVLSAVLGAWAGSMALVVLAPAIAWGSWYRLWFGTIAAAMAVLAVRGLGARIVIDDQSVVIHSLVRTTTIRRQDFVRFRVVERTSSRAGPYFVLAAETTSGATPIAREFSSSIFREQRWIRSLADDLNAQVDAGSAEG